MIERFLTRKSKRATPPIVPEITTIDGKPYKTPPPVEKKGPNTTGALLTIAGAIATDGGREIIEIGSRIVVNVLNDPNLLNPDWQQKTHKVAEIASNVLQNVQVTSSGDLVQYFAYGMALLKTIDVAYFQKRSDVRDKSIRNVQALKDIWNVLGFVWMYDLPKVLSMPADERSYAQWFGIIVGIGVTALVFNDIRYGKHTMINPVIAMREDLGPIQEKKDFNP
ncbi:MAG TPA: hypothetical protein VI819_03830 [Patescibacteria group bacterium]|nr:hypothetical protein [Patescibacteria group bacterium]